MMQVRILLFGVLKDLFGATESTIELPQGASVAELLETMNARLGPSLQPSNLRGIAVSVNAEYATLTHVLREGDEVGLLPPVSGGGPSRNEDIHDETSPEQSVVTALTRVPVDAEFMIASAKQGEDGAVVVFDGIVRNNTRGRTTLYLDYEAYEEMALRQMDELGREARSKFGVRQVIIIHRLGRLQIGETSVLVIVSSAHRAQAFDACRWLIDTLKKTVPIWKKETFADGTVWAPGEPFPAGLAVEDAEAPREK